MQTSRLKLLAAWAVRSVLAASPLVSLVNAAHAAILYDSTGGAPTVLWLVGTDNTPPPVINQPANGFILSGGNFFLDEVTVKLIRFAGGGDFAIRFWSDAGGKPGTLLESWTVPGDIPFTTDVTVSSVNMPTLTSGAGYWVSAAMPDDVSDGGWQAVNIPPQGRAIAFSNSASATWFFSLGHTDALAMKVTGIPVPEPSTWALLCVGGLLLLYRAIRGYRCGATKLLASGAIVLATTAMLAADARAVTIDTVPVGNPGNAPDQLYTFNNPGNLLFGSVNYNYRIGQHEVTNSQYVEFLNAKDATGANSLALYSSAMTSNARGGINFSAASANGAKYSVKSGRDNNPVVFVNWYDSIRFANWLNNGQGASDTETGAYTLDGGTPIPSNAATITRNAGATWFLPSENEWYKAAYYQPAALGGDTDDYWVYPMRANSVPYSDQPPGATPDNTRVGNFVKSDGIPNGYDDGYAVTGSLSGSSTQNYLTDVGAYTQSRSFYGTFDQAGNVFEWNEQLFGLSNRGGRGGSWLTGYTNFLDASARLDSTFLSGGASGQGDYVGFRVATVPEPSTLVLGCLGLLATALFLFRRAGRSSPPRAPAGERY